jgi:sugar phosphate isomerase/epimerase
MRVALGLYTLRDVPKPLPDLIEAVGDAGYDGVEFAFRVPDADPASVVDALSRSGLAVTGAHVGPGFTDDFDAHVARYRSLGCPAILLSRLEAHHFESGTAVADAADLLSARAERVADAGLDFLYHNHGQEFRSHGGELAFDRLVADSEGVGFVLDVGWAAAAGADPVALLERHGEHVPQVHLADVNESGEQVALGEGVLDVAACVEAAREAGVEWLVHEHDDAADPLGAMAEALGQIRRLAV